MGWWRWPCRRETFFSGTGRSRCLGRALHSRGSTSLSSRPERPWRPTRLRCSIPAGLCPPWLWDCLVFGGCVSSQPVVIHKAWGCITENKTQIIYFQGGEIVPCGRHGSKSRTSSCTVARRMESTRHQSRSWTYKLLAGSTIPCPYSAELLWSWWSPRSCHRHWEGKELDECFTQILI